MHRPTGAVEDTGLLVETASPRTIRPIPGPNRAPTSAGHPNDVPRSELPPETSDVFYRERIRSMRNGVLAIRRDGTVAVVNEGAYRTLGLTRRHVGQHYEDFLGTRHPFAEAFALAFDMTTLPNRAEVRLGPAGKVLGYTLSRISDEDGQVTGSVLYFKDLTRVEQLEERERLCDRLAALGEKAAAIAHEVKNPLAGIQVMAGLLKRRSSMSGDDQVVLNDIIGEAQIANKIGVDLLEFVRPINLQIESVSVPIILRNTILKYSEAAGHSDITVKPSSTMTCSAFEATRSSCVNW